MPYLKFFNLSILLYESFYFNKDCYYYYKIHENTRDKKPINACPELYILYLYLESQINILILRRAVGLKYLKYSSECLDIGVLQFNLILLKNIYIQ